MNLRILEEYLDHFRRKDYEVTKYEKFWVAYDAFHKPIGMNTYSDGILFQTSFALTKYAEDALCQFYEYINAINIEVDIVCFFYDIEKNELSATFWFEATNYDPDRFDLILKLWNQDTNESIIENLDSELFLKVD